MSDEDIHKHMFALHAYLMAARGEMNSAMRGLGENAEQYKPVLEALRTALSLHRESLDAVLSKCGDVRTAIIHTTGCDGECSK